MAAPGWASDDGLNDAAASFDPAGDESKTLTRETADINLEPDASRGALPPSSAIVAVDRSVVVGGQGGPRAAALPTPRVFLEWFQNADLDGDGKIGGSDGPAFFRRSMLPAPLLAKIWSLADRDRTGSLTYEQFCTGVWLVALAQVGKAVTLENAARLAVGDLGPRPVPQLLGINMGADTAAQLQITLIGSGVGVPSSSRRGYMGLEQCASLNNSLAAIYFKWVLPIEEGSFFHLFHSPALGPADFHAKPTVLVLGQYSVGKTTFLKHLLGREYPGALIGPEPTTDRFTAIMHGHDDRTTPGNTLAVMKDRPFTGLAQFGTQFLARFMGSELDAELLNHVTLIDTPGVLSGEKQRVDRLYDFPAVTRWFAERADLILLLFDPHKLDISDELRRVINHLAGNEDKLRVVLNKADAVDDRERMRVYGALMWALSRVIRQPEVPRVYTSNFPGQGVPYAPPGAASARLLDAERDDLIKDLVDLPRIHSARVVNEFVKRLRYLRIHVLIVARLREQMPVVMGFERRQKQLADTLELTFREVQKKHQLPVGDFPDLERFREVLRAQNVLKFPKPDPKTLARIDAVLSVELPDLMKRFGNPFDV